MAQTYPGISVVVPTFNRSQHVRKLLESLTTAAGAFVGPSEILIVDDSEREEAARVRELCLRHGARYLRGTSSVREKRNLGISEAVYPIVLFVDSDCEAAPDLFLQHADFYRGTAPEMAGVVGVTDFVGRESWMWQVITRTPFLNAFSFASRMENAPWATCSNVSYRREVLRELGGFDVTFPYRLGADDVDLGLRINSVGYRIACNPNAKVSHTRETWESFFAIVRRAFRWGRMDVHLYYRKHRDRLAVSSPRLGQVFLLVTAAAVGGAAGTHSIWPLALPWLWLIMSLILQAGITVAILGSASWRRYPQELMADLLGLVFEVGILVEGVRCGVSAVFFKTARRGPVLPTFEQREWATQAWAMWLAAAVTLLAGLVGFR